MHSFDITEQFFVVFTLFLYTAVINIEISLFPSLSNHQVFVQFHLSIFFFVKYISFNFDLARVYDYGTMHAEAMRVVDLGGQLRHIS